MSCWGNVYLFQTNQKTDPTSLILKISVLLMWLTLMVVMNMLLMICGLIKALNAQCLNIGKALQFSTRKDLLLTRVHPVPENLGVLTSLPYQFQLLLKERRENTERVKSQIGLIVLLGLQLALPCVPTWLGKTKLIKNCLRNIRLQVNCPSHHQILVVSPLPRRPVNANVLAWNVTLISMMMAKVTCMLKLTTTRVILLYICVPIVMNVLKLGVYGTHHPTFNLRCLKTRGLKLLVCQFVTQINITMSPVLRRQEIKCWRSES